MFSRAPRKELKKKFAKSNFRLPQTATVLAQQYNVKPKSWWRVWRWRILILCLFALVFVFTYSGIFKIRNVIIDNVPSPATAATIRGLIDDILRQHKLFILPQDNLVLFSSAAAKKTLREVMFITAIDIDKHWPNVVRVSVGEDIVVGVLKVESGYYTVDRRGVVINQVQDITSEIDKTVIVDRGLTSVNIGDEVMSPDLGPWLQDLGKAWRGSAGLPKLARIEYSVAELPKIYLITEPGWQVYASNRESIIDQLGSLQALLAGLLATNQDKIEYIDVRFGSKLFYKLKE